MTYFSKGTTGPEADRVPPIGLATDSDEDRNTIQATVPTLKRLNAATDRKTMGWSSCQLAAVVSTSRIAVGCGPRRRLDRLKGSISSSRSSIRGLRRETPCSISKCAGRRMTPWSSTVALHLTGWPKRSLRNDSIRGLTTSSANEVDSRESWIITPAKPCNKPSILGFSPSCCFSFSVVVEYNPDFWSWSSALTLATPHDFLTFSSEWAPNPTTPSSPYSKWSTFQ